jgi:hypothetical protein
MTLALGTVPAGTTIYIPFATYAGSTGASITLTGLAVTDIEIYKNGSVTQRSSDAGYALLDTDGIDFDSVTGLHGFSIDLNDNTDSGFYAVGSWYWVVVSAVTVDSQTVNFIAAVFRIGPAESVAGYAKADVSHFGGVAGTFSGGRPEVNTTHWAGTAVASATVNANVTQISGDSTAADNLEAAADGTGYNLGGGSVVTASVTGNVGGNVAGSVGSLAAQAKLDVNAEVDTAISDAALATAANLATVDTNVDAILVDTGTDIPATLATIAGYIDTEVASVLAAVDTEVAAIMAVTDKIDDTLTQTSDGWVFDGVALQAVWDESIGGHLVSGTTGAALNAAGAAGDPWSTELPGAYGAGTAGKIIGDNLNATVSSRATQTSVDDLPTNAELATALGTADDAVLAILGTPAGASLSADVAAVKAQTAAIETDTQDIQGRLPAALVSGRIDASVGAMAANVMTAAAAAADLTTELQSGLATASALSTVAGYLDTEVAAILAAVDTEVAAIKAKTDNLPASPAATGDIPSAASIADAVWDEAVSGHVSAGTFGKAIDDTDDRGSRTVVRGTADAGATTTSIPTSAFSPAGGATDQFKGRIVVFDNDTATAALRGQATDITGSSNAATPTLTVTALTTAPASGDSFSVL